MKNVSAGMVAYIRSGAPVFRADLYQLTLATGTVLRFTDGDADITFNGNTFTSGGGSPLMNRDGNKGMIHTSLGLTVDKFEFDMLPAASTILSFQFLTAARYGLFDSAGLVIYRCFMPTYGDLSLGTPMKVFVGTVGAVSPQGSYCHFVVNSLAILLNVNLPKHVYSAQCINTLGDIACTVNLNAFSYNLTVAAGTTSSSIAFTGSIPSIGYLSLGRMVMTSGALSGMQRSIKQDVAGPVINLWQAFPQAPGVGDTFKAFAGCNKLLQDAGGCPKFANQANYRGQDYVPVPETAA